MVLRPDGEGDQAIPSMPASPKASRAGLTTSSGRGFWSSTNAWILYPVLLFFAMAAWAASSPPGSSPDEHYHLVSAWCALGNREGLCAPGTAPDTRVVSLQLTEVSCFRFQPEAAGICPDYGTRTIETNFGNFVSYYPDGFFTVMGLFASPATELSVLGMRAFNAALYTFGLAALLFLVAPGRRANYMLGSLVTLVPLGMFIVPSVNPSSWAMTSATLLWGSAVELGRSTGKRRLLIGALAALALAMAIASRADAAAYAVLALVLAWLGNLKIGRRALISGGVLLGVVLAALIWVQSLGSFAAILAPTDPGTPAPTPDAWLTRVQGLPEIYVGAFGTSYLGWLDTPVAPITWALAGGVYAMSLFWGLRQSEWRKSLSLGVILLVGTAVPLVATALRPAGLLQARYFLPLIVLAVMVALAEDNDDGPGLNWKQGAFATVALGLANANALHTNLRRYLTGLDDPRFDLNAGVEWWWRGWATQPMTVFWLGATAFTGAAAIAAVLACRDYAGATDATPRRMVGT